MEEQIEKLVCLDASALIDYYRKTIKEKAFYFKLILNYTGFVLPVPAHFEILQVIKPEQEFIWRDIFEGILIISYHPDINETAVKIVNQLKAKRKSIEFKDLLIAAAALHYNYSLATTNTKHFRDIEGLHLITPSSFES